MKKIKNNKEKRYFEADFYYIDAGEKGVPLFTVIPQGAALSKDEQTIITILKAKSDGEMLKKVKAMIVF